MSDLSIGVDLVEIKRFFHLKRSDLFLLNNFSSRELDYCFSFKKTASHLAGTFAAKEAVFKLLDRTGIVLSSIEIRRGKSGRPGIWINGHAEKSVIISISHTSELSVAVAVKK